MEHRQMCAFCVCVHKKLITLMFTLSIDIGPHSFSCEDHSVAIHVAAVLANMRNPQLTFNNSQISTRKI